jgi:hypothetical protein
MSFLCTLWILWCCNVAVPSYLWFIGMLLATLQVAGWVIQANRN